MVKHTYREPWLTKCGPAFKTAESYSMLVLRIGVANASILRPRSVPKLTVESSHRSRTGITARVLIGVGGQLSINAFSYDRRNCMRRWSLDSPTVNDLSGVMSATKAVEVHDALYANMTIATSIFEQMVGL